MLECFPLKLFSEDERDQIYVMLFLTPFCAVFHAAFVTDISLQTYDQEYFINKEAFGDIQYCIFTFIGDKCGDLKISKYFAHVIADSIQKLTEQVNVTATKLSSAPSIRQHFFHMNNLFPLLNICGSVQSRERIFQTLL